MPEWPMYCEYALHPPLAAGEPGAAEPLGAGAAELGVLALLLDVFGLAVLWLLEHAATRLIAATAGTRAT
ncbi:MAG: hypothetical protein ACRDV3_10840 [Acidothermaceae bacterium]